MTRFPDSRDGALDCLADETGLDLDGIVGAVIPDSYVRGAWLVDTDEGAFLVYVGTHRAAPGVEQVDR